MSESIINGLAQQFGGDTISKLSSVLGASQQDTGKAVPAALPMLVGSIAGNADQPQGINTLAGALSSGHDGSILDMLGDQHGTVESSVAQFAGVDNGLGAIFDVLSGNGKPDAPQQGGGLLDVAGHLLGSSAGKAILVQILG